MAASPASLLNRARAKLASRGRFFRDVTTVLSGTVASRIVAVLAIPVLARLYTPAEFGLLAMFMTINAILSSVACLRYEMAIVLPEDESDAVHLLVASLLITTVFSVLCFVAFWFFGGELMIFVGTPELQGYLWLSALAIWLIGVFNALQSWVSRVGAFGGISRALVGSTFVTVLVQLFLMWPRRVIDGGLIIGQTAGRLMQTLQLGLTSRRTVTRALAGGLTAARARGLLARYRDFPIYDSTASILNSSSRELPVLMLGVFFSPTIIGFYSVGRRMLKVPMQLVDNAISRVFFPKASREMQKGNLDRLVLTVFAKLSAIGVVPMLTLIAIAPSVVSVFLGAKWLESVPYVQWLCVWMLIVFVSAPFAQLFNVLEKQRARLVYQVFLMAVRFATLLTGGLLGDPLLAVALFSIVSAVISLVNCLWLLAQAGLSPWVALRYFGRELLWGAPFVAVSFALSAWLDSDLVILLGALIVMGIFASLRYREVLSQRYIETGSAAA